ncbi:MAG TPA: PAAR-like protein, partial [Telluria sp.]
MPSQVSMGAMMQCTFGLAPSTLVVLPANKVLAEGPPAANIMD